MPVILEATIAPALPVEHVHNVTSMALSNEPVRALTDVLLSSQNASMLPGEINKEEGRLQTTKRECQRAQEQLNKELGLLSIKKEASKALDSSHLFDLHNQVSACQIDWVDAALTPYSGQIKNVTDAALINEIFNALKKSLFHNHENLLRDTKLRKWLDALREKLYSLKENAPAIKEKDRVKVTLEEISLLLNLSTEIKYERQILGNENSATTFWEEGKENTFFVEDVDSDETVASLYHFTQAENGLDNKPLFILAPGRGEPMEIYKEFVMELRSNGFSSLVLGFQGNGDVGDSGHVDNFHDYSNAISFAVKRHQEITGEKQQEIVLVGHSTGGTAVLKYLQECPDSLVKQVHLISPMLEINQSPLNMQAATVIDGFLTGVTRYFNRALSYFPGETHLNVPKVHIPGSAKVPFSENDLTQSPVRYGAITQIKQTHPRGAPKTPTFHWVSQAKSATEEINARHNNIPKDIDIFIYTAGNDRVVKSSRTVDFAKKIKATHIQIPGAEHSLLQEADPYRMQMVHDIIRSGLTLMPEEVNKVKELKAGSKQ